MRLLRLIWKDILRLNSYLRPAAKIAVLIFLIALMVGAWYLGKEWWMTPMFMKGEYRPRVGVIVGFLWVCLILYLAFLAGRDRNRGR